MSLSGGEDLAGDIAFHDSDDGLEKTDGSVSSHVSHASGVEESVDDSHSSDDGGYESGVRESAFTGSAGGLRFYTENERALLASIDQQRANDLGVHLYNAHALKARVWDAEGTGGLDGPSRKKRAIKNDSDGKILWYPDERWTAWPLKSSDVPRYGEQFGRSAEDLRDDQTFRRPQSWKPSGELEEELGAILLKFAKDNLKKSQQEQSSSEEGKAVGGQRMAVKIDRDSDGDDDGSSITASSELSGSNHSSNNSSQSASEPLSFQPGLPHASELQMNADDDYSYDLVRPTVREILSQFDELLINLSQSRRSLRRDAAHSDSSVRRSKSRARATVLSRHRSESGRSHDEDEQAELYDAEAHHAPRPRSVQALRPPRDWASVIGVAKLSRWDRTVIDNTVQRCTALFGPSPSLTSLYPDLANAAPARDKLHANNVHDLRKHITNKSTRGLSTAAETSNWCYCPYSFCKRHDLPFDRGFRWREHMKRTHKLDAKQIDEIERSIKGRTEKLVLAEEPQ